MPLISGCCKTMGPLFVQLPDKCLLRFISRIGKRDRPGSDTAISPPWRVIDNSFRQFIKTLLYFVNRLRTDSVRTYAVRRW